MLKLKFLIVISIIFCSCSKYKNDVSFSSSFLGAKLDNVEYLGENNYEANISPAFEPSNASPYFAFAVHAKTNKQIKINLNYGSYKHRYIPKISENKKSWRQIEAHNISVDTIKGTATITLNVGPKKIYVAAQEIESSEDTYTWMENFLKKHPEVKKVVSAKTVLNKNNYCLELENPNVKNSIVLIARQHPPETPGGTIGFKAFFEELFSNTIDAKTFRNHFNIYTFPLLNPDGADMGNWRHNASGIDLNRDWIAFTQPETKMVKNFLLEKTKRGKKIEFAVDFHTSYSGPYLLILDSLNSQKTKGIIPKWINAIESKSSFKVEARKRSQDLPYCYNFFFNQFGCESVTYEEGDEINRDIIKKRAKTYAKELIHVLNKNNK